MIELWAKRMDYQLLMYRLSDWIINEQWPQCKLSKQIDFLIVVEKDEEDVNDRIEEHWN